MGLLHGREQSLNYFPQLSYLHLPLFDTLWSYAGSIELFLETRLSRGRMIQLPSPLSRQEVVSLSQSSCVCRPVELTDGRGGWARMPGPL